MNQAIQAKFISFVTNSRHRHSDRFIHHWQTCCD